MLGLIEAMIDRTADALERLGNETDTLSRSVFRTAQAKTKDPVFQRFRRLGWIAAWADDERHVYAAHPAAKVQIEQFFTVCG